MRIFLMLFFSLYLQQLQSQVNLNSSLTACYPLNGNVMENINGLNGTLSSVTSTIDRFGNSNSAQYLVFAHNGCGSFHEGFMMSCENQGLGYNFRIGRSNSNCAFLGQIIINSTTLVNAQTWNHVGFYIGADSLKLYLNGNLDATMAYSSAILYNPSTSVFLGGSTIPTFNAPLDGNLDNVRFYNRKLSGAEFMELFLQDPFCRPEITGIEQNSYVLNSILIYPNPVEDYLEFRFDKTESKITYTIENYCGQRILNGHYDPSSLSKIDCSQLREGFYVIRIRSGGKETVLKFTKK